MSINETNKVVASLIWQRKSDLFRRTCPNKHWFIWHALCTTQSIVYSHDKSSWWLPNYERSTMSSSYRIGCRVKDYLGEKSATPYSIKREHGCIPYAVVPWVGSYLWAAPWWVVSCGVGGFTIQWKPKKALQLPFSNIYVVCNCSWCRRTMTTMSNLSALWDDAQRFCIALELLGIKSYMSKGFIYVLDCVFSSGMCEFHLWNVFIEKMSMNVMSLSSVMGSYLPPIRYSLPSAWGEHIWARQFNASMNWGFHTRPTYKWPSIEVSQRIALGHGYQSLK